LVASNAFALRGAEVERATVALMRDAREPTELYAAIVA
jgi:hypothetical protein